MPKKILIAVLPLTAFGLAGCQSLFGNNDAQMAEADASNIDMTSYYAQRLAAGRQHLASGQLAAAATAFRQASYHPDYAAQAYNGMAITYDRLGRDDLAERFFTLAINTDPSEAAYARNFALFRDAHPLSDQALEALAVREDEPQAESGALGAGLNAESNEDRIERLSAGEVRLHSADAAREVRLAEATAGQRRPAEVNVQARAQQMARARQEETNSASYPLRYALEEKETRERASRAPVRPARRIARSAPGRAYPVRVEIGGS